MKSRLDFQKFYFASTLFNAAMKQSFHFSSRNILNQEVVSTFYQLVSCTDLRHEKNAHLRGRLFTSLVHWNREFLWVLIKVEDESSNQRPENRFFSSLVLLIGLVQIRTFERGSNFIVAALTLVVLRHELLSPAVPDPKRAIIKAKVMCWIWNNGGWGTKPLRREWVQFVGRFLKESGVLKKKGYANEINTWMKFFCWVLRAFCVTSPEIQCYVFKKGINLVILLHEKFLQFDWLRAVVFQLNLKYLHVKITNLFPLVV